MKERKVAGRDRTTAKGVSKGAKAKRVYEETNTEPGKVSEPEAGTYSKKRTAASRSDKQTPLRRKNSSAQKELPNDYLVYFHKAGQPAVEFRKSGKPVHQTSFEEKVAIMQHGFTKERVLELKDRYGISLDSMAKILGVTDRTIQNKPMTFKFTGNVAEKILGLSEVYSYGVEVFEERERFVKWLHTPSPILNSKCPIELFATQLGMQQVKQELARMDYGIF